MSLEIHVLLLDRVEIVLKLVDFLHILVLNTEVLQLGFNLTDSIFELVLLLDVNNEFIKVFLKAHNFFVESSSNLIFLGFIEDEFFNVIIKFLNTLNHRLGITLNITNFF